MAVRTRTSVRNRRLLHVVYCNVCHAELVVDASLSLALLPSLERAHECDPVLLCDGA